jgi:sodium transport system ATP-binding protein
MIAVQAVEKRFGSVQAVAGVSFSARDAEVTALLGPNGAGKTTTLRMIASLILPDQGAISVDGIDVRDALAVRARLALLSDARGLYQRLTAAENIRYYADLQGVPRASREERLAALAETLDMQALLPRRTEGFSTGEKMKTAIARALIHDPNNIILDEPTNGLDVMTTRSVRGLIRALRESGKCVLLTSHVMQEVSALADRLVIITGGRIVADGPPDEVVRQSGEATLEEAFVRLSGHPLEGVGS